MDGREHRTLADREVAFVLLNTPYTISYEETAGQIDVYPTLLDVMGCNEYGWKGLGYSLFRTPVESAVYWGRKFFGKPPVSFVFETDAGVGYFSFDDYRRFLFREIFRV